MSSCREAFNFKGLIKFVLTYSFFAFVVWIASYGCELMLFDIPSMIIVDGLPWLFPGNFYTPRRMMLEFVWRCISLHFILATCGALLSVVLGARTNDSIIEGFIHKLGQYAQLMVALVFSKVLHFSVATIITDHATAHPNTVVRPISALLYPWLSNVISTKTLRYVISWSLVHTAILGAGLGIYVITSLIGGDELRPSDAADKQQRAQAIGKHQTD